MPGCRIFIIAVGILVFVLIPVSSVFAQNDTIWIKVGQSGEMKLENVIIHKETVDTFTYSIGGIRQNEPTDNIIRILHGDQPQRFKLAEKARDNKEWEKAVARYESCIKNERKDWVIAYSRFYIGECYRLWGDSEPAKLKDAIKAYDEFLKQHEKHRFKPHALSGKGWAAYLMDKEDTAKKAWKKLAAGGYGVKWEIKGKFYIARMEYEKGETPIGSDLPGIIRDAEIKEPEIAAQARLFLAHTHMNNKKYSKAVDLLETIIEKREKAPVSTVAAAYNRLGECYLNLDSEKHKQKKALFCHLKVVTLYSAVSTEYVKALRKATELLEAIGGEVYEKRAKELREEYRRTLEPEKDSPRGKTGSNR